MNSRKKLFNHDRRVTCSSDIDVIVNQIAFEEPLVTESKKPHLRRMIYSKLIQSSPVSLVVIFHNYRTYRKSRIERELRFLLIQDSASTYSSVD